jgi:TonB family protein
MQVRRHLDSIERRIIRKESSNILPEQTVLSSNPFQHRVAGNVVQQSIAEDMPIFEPELPTRGRAVFSHQFQSNESRTDEDDFSSPTFSYVIEKRRSIIPVGVFLILLAIAGAGFFFVHSNQGRRLLNIGLSRLKDVRELFGTAPVPIPPSPPAPVSGLRSDAIASKASNIPMKSEVEPPTVQSTPLNDASPHIESAIPAVSDNPRIKKISAHVMAGYLLSAPRPEYPPLARINHIEGQVALQATISKTGAVETLHVIQGSPSLHSAAINAVRNWRYTPYLVNGRPIEVITTVYVDFSLKPPPEIVH